MKTSHIILHDTIKTKHIQVDLLPENNDEKAMLDNPQNKQLEDHIIFYLQGQFPSYSVVDTIDSSNFPKRVVIRLERSTGF